jgi:hypothetical protein
VTPETPALELRCTIESEQPLESVELIVNGEIAQRFEPANRSEAGAFRSEIVTTYAPTGSGWLAWRCFEPRGGGRFRFAHSAPWHVTAPGGPLRPRREQADWLVGRVKEEIERSRGIAPPSLMDAYQRALRTYEDIAARAR